MGPAAKRVRRTSEEARRQILDAAEARLSRLGPDGLRLQDIGRDVGLSHSAILHHFASREGLIRALGERATGQLREDITAALAVPFDLLPEAAHIMDRIFAVLTERGYARLAAWLMLAQGGGEDEGLARQVPALVSDLTRVIHAARLRKHEEEGQPPPGLEDTAFVVYLAGVVAFGDGIMGAVLRRAPELGDGPDAAAAFRARFAELLAAYLTGAPLGRPGAPAPQVTLPTI